MEKEYIERETILNLLKKYGIKRGNKVYGIADIGDVIMAIENIPAADAVKVVHGKWIRMDTDGEAISKCSVCKYPVSTFWNESKYCPNCGAKMDGGNEHETD